jgi:hypothetical protein
MKSLILIVVSIAVFGVFWFRAGSSIGSNVSKNAIVQPLSITSDEQSIPRVEKTNTVQDELIHEASSSSTEPTRKEMLEEYWTLLLGDERDDWCPSKRVDKFKELSFLLTLNTKESLEYLDSLTKMTDLYWEDREFFATMLISQVASDNPREAMVFMVQGDYDFEYEDYESVARFWMDEEGVSVMDWLEKSDVSAVNSNLEEAMLTVYAEEDPYNFLLRYGSTDEHSNNDAAAGLLFDQYGAAVYEDLKLAGLESMVMNDSFKSIGMRLFSEDPAAARDWFLANRYSVDGQAATELAKQSLGWGFQPSPEVSLENLEWSMSQRLISPGDPQVQDVVKRLGNQSPEATREALLRLQSQVGDSVTGLLDILPKPKEEELVSLSPFRDNADGEEVYILNCGFGIDIEPEPDQEKVDQFVAALRGGPTADGNL